MKKLVYEVFVDTWRLASKYRFQKLSEQKWEYFIADAENLLGRYKGTEVELLFRDLFKAVQAFYEKQ